MNDEQRKECSEHSNSYFKVSQDEMLLNIIEFEF